MIICQIPINLLIQYILVFVIIASAIAWIIWKTVNGRKKRKAGCCGCSLADTCIKTKTNVIKPNCYTPTDTNNDEDNKDMEQ